MTNRNSDECLIHVRNIDRGDPMKFEVALHDRRGETLHQVTMSKIDCERLGQGKVMPEEWVRAAFRFLLDHEPKESILRRFDVSVIERYFPEFANEFPRYLEAHPSVPEQG